MNQSLSLTERAVVQLNDRALGIQLVEYNRRIDRLVNRLTGDRIKSKVCRINPRTQTYIGGVIK